MRLSDATACVATDVCEFTLLMVISCQGPSSLEQEEISWASAVAVFLKAPESPSQEADSERWLGPGQEKPLLLLSPALDSLFVCLSQ